MSGVVSEALLELRGATRRYILGAQEIHALRGIDLDIHAGEMVALIGASGSGKSTLMNVLGCLDRLDEGTYRVAGQDVSRLDPDALAALRRTHFGFVFQRYNLLSQLTALANVEIPAIYAGQEPSARHARARALLARLGLGERLDQRPNQLSGGQQQRVSIARAVMNGGVVILADEPTGALDSQTGREVMGLLLELNRLGHTLVIATHDPVVASFAHRIVDVTDGRIVSDRRLRRRRGEKMVWQRRARRLARRQQILIRSPESMRRWRRLRPRSPRAPFSPIAPFGADWASRHIWLSSRSCPPPSNCPYPSGRRHRHRLRRHNGRPRRGRAARACVRVEGIGDEYARDRSR